MLAAGTAPPRPRVAFTQAPVLRAACGRAASFDHDGAAERLHANVHEIEPAFAALVKAGRFRKVPMQHFAPTRAHNPVPGIWHPNHVGFPGGAARGVSGLRNIQFSAGPGISFEPSFGEAKEAASLLHKPHDPLIERCRIGQRDARGDADAPARVRPGAPGPDPQPATGRGLVGGDRDPGDRIGHRRQAESARGQPRSGRR